MKEYGVIESKDLNDLIKKVNEQIKNGWDLQGGIFVVWDGSNFKYYQAIFKYNTDTKDDH